MYCGPLLFRFCGCNFNTTSAEYTADYKGKEAIVMGYTGLMLPVSLKRLDAYTVVRITKEAHKLWPEAGALSPEMGA